MSKYCWEEGTIKLPSKDWAKFRKTLLDAWNAKQMELLADAQRALVVLKAAGKGKRKGRYEAMQDALHRHCGFTKESWGWRCPSDEAHDHFSDLDRLLFTRDPKVPDGRRTKLQAPKKSALDLKPVSKDADIHLPWASVHFRNKTREVTWSVGDNNHAVENAHDHWFAKRLFSALHRVEWTRGTGGQIVGNDEYNRECSYEGGGANYVTHEFSAEATKRRRRYERQSSYPSSGYGYGWR